MVTDDSFAPLKDFWQPGQWRTTSTRLRLTTGRDSSGRAPLPRLCGLGLAPPLANATSDAGVPRTVATEARSLDLCNATITLFALKLSFASFLLAARVGSVSWLLPAEKATHTSGRGAGMLSGIACAMVTGIAGSGEAITARASRRGLCCRCRTVMGGTGGWLGAGQAEPLFGVGWRLWHDARMWPVRPQCRH